MSDTFRPVAAVCAYAGLRASEALGLRWRDIDLKSHTLTVSGPLDPDVPEVALVARHANPSVTLAIYAGLTKDGRQKATAKLAEGGFGR
jgi:integrase